jgi:hypothetical protein
VAHEAVRFVAAAACVSMLSCTKEPSRPEAEAEVEWAVAEAEAVLPSLPLAVTTPPGMAADLWRDLNWLPAEVVGINGTGPGNSPLLVQWAFSQPPGQAEACRAVQRGLEAGYGIEGDAPPQSFVFYGRMDLAQVMDCAEAFAVAFEGTAHLEEGTLRIAAYGSQTRIWFAWQGERLVAVLDEGGGLGSVADARADRLAENDGLVAQLGAVDRAHEVWSASARDMTTGAIGIASRGYNVAMDGAGDVWHVRFSFTSAAQAEEALRAAGPFLAEMRAAVGIPLEVQLQVRDTVLAAKLDASEFLALPPAKMKELNEKLKAWGTAHGAPPP